MSNKYNPPYDNSPVRHHPQNSNNILSEGIFVDKLWVEPTELDPKLQTPELGLSSGPLTSLSFYFAKYCKDYSEDFMLCKNETTDPRHCLKEGRRVTRCAIDLVNQVSKSCKPEWESHWNCLDMHNHHFWECREEERGFGACLKEKLVCASIRCLLILRVLQRLFRILCRPSRKFILGRILCLNRISHSTTHPSIHEALLRVPRTQRRLLGTLAIELAQDL